MPVCFRIISTLGPMSATEPFVRECARVGQPYFRLNGSHLADDDLTNLVGLVERAAGAHGGRIYLDLQGDKRRIGELEGSVAVEAGAVLSLIRGDSGAPGEIPIPDPDLLGGVETGDVLVLQDGTVRLEVTGRSEAGVRAVVREAGVLRSRCGIHVHGKSLLRRNLPAAQEAQLCRAAELGIDALALSYVCGPEGIIALRSACDGLDYRPVIVAKVERPEAFDRLEAICDAADEIWLCRGDLGALVPLGELGALQQRALVIAARAGCPILIAGQVFHHLTSHRQPTRSEVVHLYDIIAAGAAGVVLSDETAVGIDPAGAVRTVASLGSAHPPRQP